MKTLLVVMAYPSAFHTVCRHWPYYQKAGCPILGVGTIEGLCQWPADATSGLYATCRIGKNSYIDGPHLPRKLIDVLQHCVQAFPDFDTYCLTEHDAIFLRPLPDGHPGGLVATLSCGPQQNFYGSRGLHGPWWVDRITALNMVTYGNAMLRVGLHEHGLPDYFFGLMVDLYGIRFTPAHAFSVNLIDRPEYVASARRAIANGAYYVHGIKTQEQLNAITHEQNPR